MEAEQMTKKVWFQSFNIMLWPDFNGMKKNPVKAPVVNKIIIYSMNCAWCLEDGGVHSEYFTLKTGLSLHFTDSKSKVNAPGTPQFFFLGGGGGFQMTGALCLLRNFV